MAITLPKMGLRAWNLVVDLFDHEQLADNFAKIDLHDHTPGRVTTIPTEGIADGAITAAKLATAIDPSSAYTTYKSVRNGIGQVGASAAAGSYALATNGPSSNLLVTNPLSWFYLDPADYTVVGRATMFRLVGSLVVSTAAIPGVTFTPSLIQIVSQTAGTATLGTVSSNVAAITPVANGLQNFVGTDFSLATAGIYGLAMVTGGTTAASSLTNVSVNIQVRQV